MKAFAVSMIAAAMLAVVTPVRAASPPAASPVGITVQLVGDKLVLADSSGLTLYTFQRDEGKSACNGECAVAWPPLPVAPGAAPVGGWTQIKRDDGTLQWALEGKPVYRHGQDKAPGDAKGDGLFFARWSMVGYTPPTPTVPVPAGVGWQLVGPSFVMTNYRGLSVYTFDGDSKGAPGCTGDCLHSWQPIEAPLSASEQPDWAIIERADSIRQWSYKGRPLYVYDGDAAPGQVNGAGQVNDQGAQAQTIRPLKIQHSDL